MSFALTDVKNKYILSICSIQVLKLFFFFCWSFEGSPSRDDELCVYLCVCVWVFVCMYVNATIFAADEDHDLGTSPFLRALKVAGSEGWGPA